MSWTRYETRNVNVTELSKMIDRTGYVELREGCVVTVKITDVKVSYGNVRYEIEPVAGSGRAWIQEASIVISDETGGWVPVIGTDQLSK